MASAKVRFEAIRPKSGTPRSVYTKEIRNILEKVGRQVERDFKDTTRTWARDVEFSVKVVKERGRLGITAGTDDEIYGYVNHGTRPHVIRAKNAPMLAFPGGYVAKSKPGRIVSRRGGSFGPTRFAQEVNHPGTEARKFDALIARRRQKTIETLLNKAIAKANAQVNEQRRKKK